MKRRYQEVAIKLVKTDGAELNDTLVKTLAASIAREGLLTPISVERSGAGYDIISGRHRLAAVKQLGHRSVDCLVNPASRSSAEHMARVLAENVVRTHWKPAELNAKYKELVDLWTIIHEENEKSNDLPLVRTAHDRKSLKSGKGTGAKTPEKTPRGKAIGEVAKVTGKTPAAVRRAVDRATKAEEAPPESPETEAEWSALAECLKEADQAMQRAQGALGRAKAEAEKLTNKAAKNWALEAVAKWAHDTHELAFDIRYSIPADTCPRCRGGGCKSCKKLGFASKRQIIEIEAAKR